MENKSLNTNERGMARAVLHAASVHNTVLHAASVHNAVLHAASFQNAVLQAASISLGSK